MKICLIGEFTNPGWEGSATNKVQRALLKELGSSQKIFGCEISEKKGKINKIIDNGKFINIEEGVVFNGGIISIIKALAAGKPDILHFIVLRRYMLILFPLKYLFKVKIAVTFHDTLDFRNIEGSEKIYFRKLLYYIAGTFADKIFCYNKSDLVLVEKIFGKKVELVMNGTYFKRRNFVPDNSLPVIFYAGGRKKIYKGYHLLVKALEGIESNFKLIICGEGETKENNESYPGQLNEKQYPELLSSSDIAVIPSLYESFSLVAIEALTTGLPVVISNSCGAAEYLTDVPDAFIFNSGDAVSLKEKILEAAERVKNPGTNDKASEIFKWNLIITDYIKIYNKMTANERAE